MESLGVTIKVGVDRSFADEVYSLLGSIGFKKYTSYYPTKSSPWVYTNNNGNIMHCSFKADNNIEVDINQLRDLVVLKRNDVGDATHSCDRDSGLGVIVNGKWYQFNYFLKKWELWEDDTEYKIIDLKPIEKTMKEFLNPNQGYKLVCCAIGETPIPENWIEVPEGAEVAKINLSESLNFYKQVNGVWWLLNSITNNKWHKPEFNNERYNPFYGSLELVWQRDKPEELKSIGFDLGVEGGDETKITTIENPLFPDFFLSEPVVENNDFNGLDKSEINHRVAKSFNVIRDTNLTEDDIHFLRQLIDLTTSHYWNKNKWN